MTVTRLAPPAAPVARPSPPAGGPFCDERSGSGDPITPHELSPGLSGRNPDGTPLASNTPTSRMPSSPSASVTPSSPSTDDDPATQAEAATSGTLGSLRDAGAAFEGDFIRRALAQEGNDITQAAKAMGLSRVALQKKMKDYGLR